MTKHAVYCFEESSSWNEASALVGDEVEQKNLFKYVVSVAQEHADIDKDQRNKISCGCLKWRMIGGVFIIRPQYSFKAQGQAYRTVV